MRTAEEKRQLLQNVFSLDKRCSQVKKQFEKASEDNLLLLLVLATTIDVLEYRLEKSKKKLLREKK